MENQNAEIKETGIQTGLKIFTNDQFGQVRVVMKDGEPWFVAADVCEYFGVSNRNRIMQTINSDEKGGTQMITPGGTQTVAIVSEPGLYSLLFAMQPKKGRGISGEHIQKRCEQLDKFKRWITHEVIPSIRKTGMYATEDILGNPDFLVEVAMKLRDEHNARIGAELKLEEQKPKVAFYDHVSNTENLITVGNFAKLMADKGIKIGRQRLFAWLQRVGLLDDRNHPYQLGLENGWFKQKETTIHRYGQNMLYLQTFVTGKGQQYLLSRLVKEYTPAA